jgi:hypothetical protein
MGKKNEGEEKKKSDKSHSEYQEAKWNHTSQQI